MIKKLLIVEDEVLIAKSLKKLIEKRGLHVDVESSGKKAIQRIVEGEYDRIICDLMLQDISGFDVIEESKTKFDLSNIRKKFVIITAYCSPQVLSKAASYGCLVLGKPFENIAEAIEIFISEEPNDPKEANKI